MNKVLKSVLVVGMTLLVTAATPRPTPKSDISSVVAAGSVNGDIYMNTYFGISLTGPKAHFTTPSSVNVVRQHARLINIVYDSPDGAVNYTLALLADSRDNYPKGMSTTVYVRSARHELERDGLITRREEFPLVISGLPFTGAVLIVQEKPNFGYYRGIYSTFRNGYVVSLEVQARTEEHIQQLLSSAVKINPAGSREVPSLNSPR
jgi:hypothetical protein